jgi:hypothetical protein
MGASVTMIGSTMICEQAGHEQLVRDVAHKVMLSMP